jgi:hypothetical protein
MGFRELFRGSVPSPAHGGHVEFDASKRRLRLAHGLIRRMVAWGVDNNPDLTLVGLEWATPGYRCQLGSHGKTVTTTLYPRKVIWKPETLVVELTSPDGVAIEGNPILNALIAAMALAVGGPGLGESVRSRRSLPQVRWNDKTAICSVEAPGKPLPSWAGSAPDVTVKFSGEESGMWLSSDRVAHLVPLATTLGGLFGKKN